MRAYREQKNIAIIGGGITGLSAAHTIQKYTLANNHPATFILLEGSDRLGGKIKTEQRNGFVIEGGPDSFFQQKPWATDLARELGLESELIGINPAAKKVLVASQGQLIPMPEGMILITPTRLIPWMNSPLISLPGKIRGGLEFLIPSRKDERDESVGDFVRRRAGEEALQKIAEPLLAGIHVSDPDEQSLLATFPQLKALEKQYGSLMRGMHARLNNTRNGKPAASQVSWQSSAFVSFRGGMKQLVTALEGSLANDQVLTGKKVIGVMPRKDSGYIIQAEGHADIEVDAVIFATPAYETASLVKPFAADLATALNAIRYVTTATVSLAYQSSSLEEIPGDASGFIVPRTEKRKVLAGTLNSIKFSQRAPQGYLLLRCFLGGAGREENATQSDAEIIESARSELGIYLGIQAKPVLTRVFRWEKGNPQYDVGHLERIRQIRGIAGAYPNLFLAGSAYEGVGIPDCIHQGAQATEKALAGLRIERFQTSDAVNRG